MSLGTTLRPNGTYNSSTKLLHEVEIRTLANEFRFQIDNTVNTLKQASVEFSTRATQCDEDVNQIANAARDAKADVDRSIGRVVDALLQRKKQLNRLIDAEFESKVKVLSAIRDASAAESAAAAELADNADHITKSKGDANLVEIAEKLLSNLRDGQNRAEAFKLASDTYYLGASAPVNLQLDEQDAILQVSMLGVVGAPAPPAFLPDLVNVGSTDADIKWEPLTIPGVTQPSGALAVLSTLAASAISLDAVRPGTAPLTLKQISASNPAEAKACPELNENLGLFQVVANAASNALNVPHSRGFISPESCGTATLPPAPLEQFSNQFPEGISSTPSAAEVSAATESRSLARQVSAAGLVPGQLTRPASDSSAQGKWQETFSGRVLEAPSAQGVTLTPQGTDQGFEFVETSLVSAQGPSAVLSNSGQTTRASALDAVLKIAQADFSKRSVATGQSQLLPTPVTYTLVWARVGSLFDLALQRAGSLAQIAQVSTSGKPLNATSTLNKTNELALATSKVSSSRYLGTSEPSSSSATVVERSPAPAPESERPWQVDDVDPTSAAALGLDVALNAGAPGTPVAQASASFAAVASIAPVIPRSLLAEDEGVAEGIRSASFAIQGLRADTVYRVYLRAESTVGAWDKTRAPFTQALVIKTGRSAATRPVQLGGADPTKAQVQLDSTEALTTNATSAITHTSAAGVAGGSGTPQTNTSKWKALPQLNVRRAFASAAVLLNRVVVTGGFNSLGLAKNPTGSVHSNLSTTAEILSHTQSLVGPISGTSTAAFSATGALSSTSSNLPTALSSASRAGAQAGAVILRSVEALDLEHHRWVAMPDMISPRRWHASVSVNNKLYVLGGFDGTHRLRACEVFDPRTGIWTAIAPMLEPRDGHAAVGLPSGHILVMGGYDGERRLASCELYDVNTNTWKRVASLRSAREGLASVVFSGPIPTSARELQSRYSAVLRNDADIPQFENQLYVCAAGGYDGHDYLRSTEVYDPIRNIWLTGPPLRSPRYLHSLYVIPAGTIDASSLGSDAAVQATAYDGLLVAGGMNNASTCTRFCEVLPLSPKLLDQIISGVYAEAIQTATVGIKRTGTAAIRPSAAFDSSARSRLHEEDVSMGMYSSPSTKTLLAAATQDSVIPPSANTTVTWVSVPELAVARAGAASVLLPSYADLPPGMLDYAELKRISKLEAARARRAAAEENYDY